VSVAAFVASEEPRIRRYEAKPVVVVALFRPVSIHAVASSYALIP